MSESIEKKVTSLLSLFVDLIVCAAQQATIRQRLREDLRAKGVTNADPPNIKVPLKDAEAVGISQAEAIGLANDTQALSARGAALATICNYFNLPTDDIVASHQKVKSDRVIGLVVLPHDIIKRVFALQTYVAQSELSYEDFLFFFDPEDVRLQVRRILNWNVDAIREWHANKDLQRTIDATITQLETNFAATVADLQVKLSCSRAKRVDTARRLYEQLRAAYPDKKTLAKAAKISPSTLYKVLTEDETPQQVAATIPGKTIENVIACLERLTTAKKPTETAETPKQRPPTPSSHADNAADASDETFIHYVNTLQEQASLGKALRQNEKYSPSPRAKAQGAIAIGKLMKVFELTMEDVRRAVHGEPLDSKTANLLKGK